jgi:hypothetical protein
MERPASTPTLAPDSIDFGSSEESSSPTTEAIGPNNSPETDAGSTTPRSPASTAVPFGDSPGSHTPQTKELEWNRFYKFYQLWVLLILLAFLSALTWFDFYVATITTDDNALNGKDYLDKILPVVVPVFTFLLGMTTKQKAD